MIDHLLIVILFIGCLEIFMINIQFKENEILFEKNKNIKKIYMRLIE